MKNILTILICLFLTSILSAQKFGKVPDELVKESVFPGDSTADAAYYVSNSKVWYQFTSYNEVILNMEYHYRIKVYQVEGEQYGNFDILLYKTSRDREKIRNLEAYSYNYVDGKVVKTKLEKKQIFEEELSENYTKKTFAVPNVKPGSVIEVKYKLQTPFFYSIPKWYFQKYIPVVQSKFELTVPEYFVLTPVPTGVFPISRKQEDVSGSRHNEIKHTLSASDLPAMKEDEYVLNADDYRAGIKYELYSVTFGSNTEYLSKDWNSISKNLTDNKKWGKELKKGVKALKPIVAEAQTKSTQKEKIDYIYQYIRDNMAWNKDYGTYPEQGLKKSLEAGTGNVADINMLLINGLREAGIVAHPFLIKTRQSGLLNTSFPSATEFNYLIAAVRMENNYFFLDATSKYVPMGQLPIRAINASGLMVEGERGVILPMTNPNSLKVQTGVNYTVNLEDICLDGEGISRYTNYGATKFRIDSDKEEDEGDNQEIIEVEKEEEEYADGGDDEGYEDEVEEEEEEKDIDFEDEFKVIEVVNFEDRSKFINAKFTARKFACIKKIGDQIFLDADLDYGISENPFTEESRDYPIFYNYKVDLKRVVSIEMPEGYVLESAPEKLSAALPENKGQFIYEVKNVSGKLLVYYTLKINSDTFGYDDYSGLKQLYDMVLQKQDEKIVLGKG